jgi:hypothetical protein
VVGDIFVLPDTVLAGLAIAPPPVEVAVGLVLIYPGARGPEP